MAKPPGRIPRAAQPPSAGLKPAGATAKRCFQPAWSSSGGTERRGRAVSSGEPPAGAVRGRGPSRAAPPADRACAPHPPPPTSQGPQPPPPLPPTPGPGAGLASRRPAALLLLLAAPAFSSASSSFSCCPSRRCPQPSRPCVCACPWPPARPSRSPLPRARLRQRGVPNGSGGTGRK